MSKHEATIGSLRQALRIANLPHPQDPLAPYEKNAAGEVVAASMAFRVGYMESSIRAALADLGVSSSRADDPEWHKAKAREVVAASKLIHDVRNSTGAT